MSSRSGSHTPRSKRSTTNLANLRLAPLSARFTEPATPRNGEGNAHLDFTDLSVLHRSAPSSPRGTSRTANRKYASGLSRRSSLYENDPVTNDSPIDPEGYFNTARDETRLSAPSQYLSSGQVPKAKSEAALGIAASQQRLAGHGVQVTKRKQNSIYSPNSRSGTNTPRASIHTDDWLTRTGQATSHILQEQKGQAFLSSRNSNLALDTTAADLTDDDDEGYEELAANSARATPQSSQFADDELSPVSTRASRWGSRYGSRANSRKTSRRGSMVQLGGAAALRPLSTTNPIEQERGSSAVLDTDTPTLPIEADFEEDSSADEGVVAAHLTSLGGFVDRIIGLNLFSQDGEATGESEMEEAAETETEARQRRSVERGRRREEKERLVEAQQRCVREGVGEGGVLGDVRWLAGVAREAMF